MNALQACHRAYWAWIRTQPQLMIPGVLDEPDRRVPAVGFVEPAGFPRQLTAASPPGGLTTGATEPCCEQHRASTSLSSLAVAPARSGASVASPESDGTVRRTPLGQRGRCQKGD